MKKKSQTTPPVPDGHKKLSGSGLFSELKRRRVLSFTAGYVLSCWFVIEVSSVVLPAFNAPDWVLRFLIIAAVAASPICIVLAWFYDVTRRGIVLTDDDNAAIPQATEKELLPDSTVSGPVIEAATGLDSSSRGAAPERRLVTVLQCSTAAILSERDEEHAEQLRQVLPLVIQQYRNTVEGYDGYLLPTEGELVTAYFGVQIAHEDASLRATRSAREMVKQIDTYNAAVTDPEALKLEINIGIHCGFAIVEEMADENIEHWVSSIGHTLKSVAALQISAAPNEIRLSHEVYGMLQEQIRCEHVGTIPLPGSAAPKDIYRVTLDSEDRRTTPRLARDMVGREREVDLLDECWDNARESLGQVVVLRGEAGIGKSRLIRAVLDRIAREEKSQFIVLHCSAYHTHSSLFPLIAQLQKQLGFSPADSNGDKLKKLENYLGKFAQPVKDVLPGFAALLSLEQPDQEQQIEPERKKELLLEALHGILLNSERGGATFIVVEDLHWADPTFLDLLDLMIAEVPAQRVMVLLSCRPNFKLRWTDHSHINLLNINRLNNQQARQLIGGIDKSGNIDEQLIQTIIEKTDGVPLYLEEFSRSVIEASQRGEQVGRRNTLSIPNTLQESLAARIHHLGTAKSLLHLGATIGREFSHALLAVNSGLGTEELSENLAKLVDREVIYKRGSGEEVRYVFKHALIQEACYSSMLKSKREEYHLRVAQSLEQHFPEVREQHPEIIARHYSASRAIDENLESASQHWCEAAGIAARRFANVEADHFLSNALEQLQRMPASDARDIAELRIQSSRIPVLVALHGYSSKHMAQASERALVLCETVSDFENKFIALFSICVFYMVGGAHRASHQAARQIEELCRDQADAFRLEAFMLMGLTQFFLGELEEAETNLRSCIKLYDREQHGDHGFLFGQDPEILSMSYLAWIYFAQGDSERMAENRARLIASAQSLQHPHSRGFAYAMSAWQMVFLDDFSALPEYLTELELISEKYGLTSFRIQSEILSALALCKQGEFEPGLVSLEQGLQAWRDIGSRCYLICWDTLFAQACINAGLLEKATSILDRAEQELVETEEAWAEGEWLRCRAALASVSKRSSQATDYWQRSLDHSRSRSASGWGIRAACDYGEYLMTQDKSKALAVLTEALSALPCAARNDLGARARSLVQLLED